MLAVFEKGIGKPPEELSLPSMGLQNSKTRQEIAETLRVAWPEATMFSLSNGNFLALSHEDESPTHPRPTITGRDVFYLIDNLSLFDPAITRYKSIVVVDDVFCIFVGTLENICDLRRHYGLSRQATEAMVVVEAYKVLRDRAPYPPDQVIRDLEGKFAFILFDARAGTLFTARDRDGSINLQWGMAGDGSLVCSDNPKIITEACGKACAPFPPGCIFMNGSGLMSFDHPLHKVRAIAREDDDGSISAIIFQVDLLTRLPSIPRTGSAANWADAAVVNEE